MEPAAQQTATLPAVLLQAQGLVVRRPDIVVIRRLIAALVVRVELALAPQAALKVLQAHLQAAPRAVPRAVHLQLPFQLRQ